MRPNSYQKLPLFILRYRIWWQKFYKIITCDEESKSQKRSKGSKIASFEKSKRCKSTEKQIVDSLMAVDLFYNLQINLFTHLIIYLSTYPSIHLFMYSLISLFASATRFLFFCYYVFLLRCFFVDLYILFFSIQVISLPF